MTSNQQPSASDRARRNQQAAALRVARRTRDLLSWDNGKACHPEPGEAYTHPDPD